MIAAILLVLLALAVGGVLGTLVLDDPGYVMLAYGNYTFETSLWIALLLLLVAYLSARVALRALGALLGSWGLLRRLGARHGSRRARDRTARGLTALAEGEFSSAKRQLLAAADRSDMPLVNFLGAARAAHELGDAVERDALLQRAHRAAPGGSGALAVGLTQAELQLGSGQLEQGLATLLRLRDEAPRNPYVLKLLLGTYEQLGDWPGVESVYREALRQGVIDGERAEALRLRVAEHHLQRDAPGPETSPETRVKALMSAFRRLPRTDRVHPGVLRTQIELLLGTGSPDGAQEAERLLREWLAHDWDPELVAIYGRIEARDGDRQLLAGEGWLKERPGDPVLLLALGRIAARLGRTDKAREYFLGAAEQQRSADALAELGQLDLRAERPEAACAAFREALRRSGHLVGPEAEASKARPGAEATAKEASAAG